MDSDRWKQIDSLLQTVLERPPEERDAFLRHACAGDEALDREVRSLLTSQQQAESFLESPAIEVAAGALVRQQSKDAQERADSLIGRTVSHYRIVGKLGSGGMGVVYKADDTRLPRFVALKFLSDEFARDPEALNRFRREARAASALNHPHICQLYDVGPNYLVMEFIEGTRLAGPLPLDPALRYAVQIADALSAAHDKGITHRDLKPANILVTASGVKLLDFGLAKIALGKTRAGGAPPARDAQTQTMGLTEAGTILGTASYMSPEQSKGEEADARSDVFSFGLVLYEMLSGRQAFAKNSAIETMAAIVRDEPAPLDAPLKLSAIITRCLRKLPASRFQTMNEVRTALEQAAREQATAKPAGNTPSIAVLPFANMSRDPDDEYFSDGLAEEIINALTQVKGLKVVARTSAFAFKGKNEDIRKIAETLGASNVLEGSVRRSGNRLRVTAQLIHAAESTHLWSQRYDRDMTDIFAIQDEIAQAISEALQVQLAPRARTVNIEAYQDYLKGQYYRVRYTADSLAKAKECFEQALAIDPNYAAAYGGLAGYYYGLAGLGMKPAGEVAPLAKSAAEKALAIDPANNEAHSVLAIVAAAHDYDWKMAETHFRQAMAAEPIPPTVRFRYVVYYLLPLGRVADAMGQSRLGLETDPLSMILHWGMALSMNHAKLYREAIAYARRALEIDPNFYLIWYGMGLAQLGAGFTQEGVASLKRVVELAPWLNVGVGSLAAAYYQAGDRERSQEWARKLTASHGHAFGAALYYAAAGEVDAMFEALEGAYRHRDHFLPYIQTLLFFDPYRADPRFQALLRRMNLA